LLQGSGKTGFPTDLWICPCVAQLIPSLFIVQHHVDHVGKRLHALGWNQQKPESRAIERNEEASKFLLQQFVFDIVVWLLRKFS
jgi:transposase